MATTPKRGMRTRLTDAGMAARRRMERLRGGNSSAIADKAAPEHTSAGDEVQGDPTAPSDSPARALWRTVQRARLALVVLVALTQVVLALVSWRIKASRARRRGQPDEQEALDDVATKLGDLAGKVDASGEG